MKQLDSSGLRLILPLLPILVFAVLLGVALFRMVKVESEIRVDAETNMLWVMHQSESAARQLLESTMRVELGEADADEIALRLDLLRSRFNLMQDGPQQRFLNAIGLKEQVAALHAELAQIAPPSDDFTPTDARKLRERLAPFPTFFARAATTTMIREWDNLGGRLETYRNQLRQVMLLLIGIMLTGAVLVVMLFLALRLSHRRNELLHRERDLSALLISSGGEGILAIDRTRKCTIWNPAIAEMTGKTAEEAIGRKLDDITGFFDIIPVRQAVNDAFDGEETSLVLQSYFRDVTSAPLYVDLRVSPLREDQVIVGIIIFMYNANDRFAAREKEAETRERLERLVAERTRELDDALLRERSATDLYRNFAGMISHQFRTPLAVADSALQRLIRRGPRADRGEITERATTARNAISGLTRLVESTLDTARLQAGQIGSQPRPCDLKEVLGILGTQHRAADPCIKFAVTITDPPENIAFCDPAHAEQMLENLLSNAVKYADSGTEITAHLHGDEAHVFCDIANHGPAINPAETERLFEPNFRGRNSLGKEGKGIGLFIARSLARMQGGEIELLTNDEKITFRLTLPRAGVGTG